MQESFTDLITLFWVIHAWSVMDYAFLNRESFMFSREAAI
jgi:hypothetical protein